MVQVIFESNSARHVQESARDPRKRAYTVDELQDLCDTADEQVDRSRDAGVKGPMVASRTATITKFAYAWGCAATRLACWTSGFSAQAATSRRRGSSPTRLESALLIETSCDSLAPFG